jgi:hypothetical protein
VINLISVNRINYAGYSSQDFNLRTCLSFGGDSGDVSAFLNREAVASESYRGHFKRVHNYKYSDVLAPTLTFIKDNFEDFTIEEHRKVLKWLTSKDTASFLTIYHDDSEVISYEILGGFTEINSHKSGNGRIVGITAVFESVAPWAFSSLYTITKDVSSPTDNKIIINLETDDPQNAVYPRVTIQQDDTTNIIEINHIMTDTDNWVEGSVFKYNDTYYWVDAEGVKHTSTANTSNFDTTSVSIKNTYTDDRGDVSVFDAIVKNNVVGEKIVLDGANRVVSNYFINDLGEENMGTRIFGDNFSWDWIPLYEGKNELSFVGNCIVTIEYRTPIKCGEF